jgi:hypothetical protein
LKKTPDADEDDDEDRRRYGGLLTLAKFWKNGPPQDGFFWEDELCYIEYHIHLPRNIWDTPAILLLMGPILQLNGSKKSRAQLWIVCLRQYGTNRAAAFWHPISSKLQWMIFSWFTTPQGYTNYFA